ncbi:MAG: dihydrofolate reductase family protein [Actinomycetota bacterium]|nr:dihydrofolate reductase family protein [Actinomycetota bacterium]
MRKVTAGLFHSLDGVVEAPNLWQFDSFDDELGAELTGMIDRVDTVLLGRVGYQEWASYWPKAEKGDPFGSFINPVEKYVASRTLTGDLEWQNSRLIDGSLEDFVAALKETSGGEISVCGSISVVRQLLFAGLLDTLTVMTHPVIAGSGRHLFEPSDPVTRLTLQDARRTSKGNAILDYGLRTE